MQMKQLEGQQTENLDDNDRVHNRDDTFAKVMGADKHGHVRMYGMGVTPADIYGNVPSRDANYRMAMEYKDKYLQVVDKYEALNEKLENLSAIVHGRAQSVGERDRPNIPVASPNNQHSSSSSLRPMRIQVHSYVVLKSLGNINDVVASGYVNQMDSIRVNGEELGHEWCEVIVEYQMKKNVRLLKPYDHIQTIGDALGAPVAWPLSLVALDENND
ncbi:hypothetical protein Salat_0238300 [Sesamum alatum]|uniref:Transposase Tnp1/En/Spm-like domain-containing protein n=1 Tax=Sesamum alatum TaxID=300844 RepID=A0AAE1Z0F4_9LAMI|nr:hypothetical protein Salat_0238300 [Sesamum alatum]